MKCPPEISPIHLLILYEEKISGTTISGTDGIKGKHFEDQLAINCSKISSDVDEGKYKFRPYKEKLISKGRNKPPRIISIPTVRDRLTLRAIFEILRKEFKTETKLIRPQKIISQIKAVDEKDFKTVTRIDIENFYGTINHAILQKKLEKKIKNNKIIKIIMDAISTPTISLGESGKKSDTPKIGVPQGLSISNCLAAIYLYEFDKFFKETESYRFFRYVDDILIFCNKENKKDTFEKCKKLLKRVKLTAHQPTENGAKTKISESTDSFEYLGYQITKPAIIVKKSSYVKMYESIQKIITQHKHHHRPDKDILIWRINLRITGCIFEEKRRGWMFYFSQITEDNRQQLFSIDKKLRTFLSNHLDEEQIKSIKRISRSYYEINKRFRTTKYIPNFDNYSSIEMRSILEKVYKLPNIHKKTDTQIQKLFKAKIGVTIRELEKDSEPMFY
ncbi:reverse transcriptase domain-containing protein [Thalassospira marina]|uniref:Reverse transcriptase domain-containing protein n=1 Tax=Thalassospira marina TaxID=2048283 RepID=A0ABN5FKP8_9PROT|nr:reverse transcriptase domain-containing protein [Thalassospira marina]AUG54464.1 hypothetical protein CSC3H3_18425 [Thalassospira marina]